MVCTLSFSGSESAQSKGNHGRGKGRSNCSSNHCHCRRRIDSTRFSYLLTLQGLPPLDAQSSLFLGLYLPPPRIQTLFVGLVVPLVLHFLHPILLTLRVLAFHLTPLLLRHGTVASQTLFGFFGLEGLVLPIRSHTGHALVVASTVRGLHVLYPIQGAILALPIQFLVPFVFFRVPLFPGVRSILAYPCSNSSNRAAHTSANARNFRNGCCLFC